jgi:hypothetical protein
MPHVLRYMDWPNLQTLGFDAGMTKLSAKLVFAVHKGCRRATEDDLGVLVGLCTIKLKTIDHSSGRVVQAVGEATQVTQVCL